MATGERLTGRQRAAAQQEPALRLPPVGFWSYARQDDELSGGRLSRLRLLLAQELQQQYGREQVRLFQDMSAIAHGADWEREIRRAIDESSFFIPIITPNFLQSEWCSREVILFLEREQKLRAAYPEHAGAGRIFPILFIGVDDAEPEDAEVLAALQKLQWFDFRRYRHRSFDEPEVLEALSELASTMRSLLKTRVGGSASSTHQTVASHRSGNAPNASDGAAAQAAGSAAPAQPGRATGQIEVGDRLNNIFEVKRFIKAGGMGQVFEGTNIRTGERVAIKALLPAMAGDQRIAAMFEREAMTLTRLNHEALVQYRVFAEEPALGVLYIVTEYVEGVDLAEAMGRADRSPEELTRLTGRLASGLAAAHRLGAVHRDISPDNIMLPGGDIHLAKIIDFGIAKDLAGNLTTIVGDSFAGKLGFVAPEQLGDYDGEIGPWTDVYSLALVILAFASGRKPDMGGSFADAIRKRRETVDVSAAPAVLQPLLADMLRADPSQRLRSMDEVIARLDQGPDADGSYRQVRITAEANEARSGYGADEPAFARAPRLWFGLLLGAFAIAAAAILFWRIASGQPEAPPAPPQAAPKATPERAPGGGGATPPPPAPMPSETASPSSQPKAATRPATQTRRNDRQVRPDRAPQQQRTPQQAQAEQPPQAQRPRPRVSDYCTEYPNSPMCAPVPRGRTYCEINPRACQRPSGFR